MNSRTAHHPFIVLLFFVLSTYLVGLSDNIIFAEEDAGPAVQEEKSAYVYDDHGKRDPFLRLVDSNGAIVKFGKEFSVTDLHLEGIMFDEKGNSIAIINGNVVKQRDVIGPFDIHRITSNSVILKKGQDLITLKLKKEESYD